MKVVLRADASTWIGSGHVRRCVTLGQRLLSQGASVHLVTRELPGDLSAWASAQEIAVHRTTAAKGPLEVDQPASPHEGWLGVPYEQEIAETSSVLTRIAHDSPIDWVIVDHYGIEARWEQAARAFTNRIMVVDDLADRPHDTDLLLDQNLWGNADERYSTLVSPATPCLIGPRHAILGPEYAELHPHVPPRDGRVERLLIYFGSIDANELTLRSMRIAQEIGAPDLSIDAVLPHSPVSAERIREASNHRTRLHQDLPTLAWLLARADLAIGASGATTWERCAMGVPTLTISDADNQHAIAAETHDAELTTWLGPSVSVTDEALRAAIAEALGRGADHEQSIRGRQLVDGRGVERIAARLESVSGRGLTLRAATIDDLSPEGGASVSRTAPHISPEVLRFPDRRQLLVMESTVGCELAVVEFVSKGAEWELTVHPDVTSVLGVSSHLLRTLACRWIDRLDDPRPGTEGESAARHVRSSADVAGGDGLRIGICSDVDSWMQAHIPELAATLLDEGHLVQWVHAAERLVPGDVCLLLSYGQIVDRDVRSRFDNTVVVHASDLPKGRGWSPLTWQVMEGANRIPVTLFEAADDVDSGPIYRQAHLQLDGHELIDDLRAMLARATFELCRDFVRNRDTLVRNAREQIGEPSYYPRRRPADSELDPARPINKQFDLLRTVDNNRYPAWFEIDGRRYWMTISHAPPTDDPT